MGAGCSVIRGMQALPKKGLLYECVWYAAHANDVDSGDGPTDQPTDGPHDHTQRRTDDRRSGNGKRGRESKSGEEAQGQQQRRGDLLAG